ncbi:MAG: hypothetical protein FWG12_05415 [Holophagaceae bacterium]|nr:hypothetical protein [Holophagaceae bacterium]
MKIFLTDISASDTDTCLALLGEDERIKVATLNDNVKRRFLVSRAFRRRILGPEAVILTDNNGRPYVEGNPVFFSMTHTGDFLVLAVDDNPVGIDAELMKQRNFTKLSAWFFGETIPGCEDFYRRWTRFEAGLKLAGMTLLSKDVPEPKHLYSKIIGDYMLSIASNRPILPVFNLTTIS